MQRPARDCRPSRKARQVGGARRSRAAAVKASIGFLIQGGRWARAESCIRLRGARRRSPGSDPIRLGTPAGCGVRGRSALGTIASPRPGRRERVMARVKGKTKGVGKDILEFLDAVAVHFGRDIVITVGLRTADLEARTVLDNWLSLNRGGAYKTSTPPAADPNQLHAAQLTPGRGA